MRIIRLFHSGDYQVSQTLPLNENAAHHAAVVLRLKVGHHLTLFNGKNEEFDATIVSVSKKSVEVEITAKRYESRESPCKIHLGQAIIKEDRMAWLIQKAVELGVTEITPLIASHTAFRYDQKRIQKKIHQWQGIIIGACEQCGRNQLPILNEPTGSQVWFSRDWPNPLLLLPGATTRINKNALPSASEFTLAIGPEGGWSSEEEILAETHQWLPISLGPRILRAETAALSAISLLQGSMGDI